MLLEVTNSFLVVEDEKIVRQFSENAYVGFLDGRLAQHLNDFYNQIGKAFNLPDYLNNNLNSLEECLNDLEWLNAGAYLLVIKHYSELLLEEDKEVLYGVLELLDRVSTEWANVPNFAGEEEYRRKAAFKTIILGNDKVLVDLNLIGITPAILK